MNPARIQQKIFYGYAKASSKLGAYFSLYRAPTPISPISIGNLIGNTRMSKSITWNYMTANKYGNAVFNACVDARRAQAPNSVVVGDFLIPAIDPDSGFIEENETYFIQSLQFDLPPKVVQCNNVISILRPAQPTGAGDLGYVGYTPPTADVIATDMPASVLLESGGQKAETKLPTDTKEPNWIVLFPNFANLKIMIGDIITDSANQDYVIYNNETTDLGWRIKASQVVNNG